MDVGLQRYEGGNWFSVAQEMIVGWIKCSNKMPPNGVMVLLLNDGDYDFGFIIEGRLHVFSYGKWKPLRVEKVSHWQPLPPPPTE